MAHMTLEATVLPERRLRDGHPILRLVGSRTAFALLTLLAVSVIVFVATMVLPGNAAKAILGQTATPARVRALQLQLNINHSVWYQYWAWITGIIRGHFGISYAARVPAWQLVGPRLLNSAVLVALSGIIGSVIGVGLGALAAVRRDGRLDQVLSIVSLAVTSLPEFVVGIVLVIVFATTVMHVLPAVSLIPAGSSAWQNPKVLVLPTATLVIVIVPYILRMTRAATIDALESDYFENARLKGLRGRRLLLVHALPNAIPPVVQVIGLNLLYLAGGIVVVETLFAFPGIGQGLVNAVNDRDVPVIQLSVLILAAFYVFVNIASDVASLLASPRRRLPRS
jgi:peptide/nickel transport system permease protein